jgi:tetratricopeptide (TPR) repeat protein
MGEYDQAIEKYQRALQLNRAYLKAYLLLGDAYVAMGALDQAAGVYQQAVRLDPQGALQLKRMAVEETPGDYVGHQSLALLYDQLGQRDLALSEAIRARDLAPASERAGLERFIARLEK